MLLTILGYVLLPAVLLVAGGVVATLRAVGAGPRSAILHFAAGLVFAVVAVELIPDMLRQGSTLQVSAGFVVGSAAMLLLSRLTAGAEAGAATSEHLPLAMLLAIAADLAIDGLLLGIGFAAGTATGRLLSLALSAEFLSLGLALATTLRAGGTARAQTGAVVAGLAALFAVVALLGGTLLQGLGTGPLVILLSFGAAALLFLVTEELLVEAHEAAQAPVLTGAFFAGFLLFLILGMHN